jgi:hypothetical protein
VQLTAQQAILDQIATTRLIIQLAGEILQAVQLTGTIVEELATWQLLFSIEVNGQICLMRKLNMEIKNAW